MDEDKTKYFPLFTQAAIQWLIKILKYFKGLNIIHASIYYNLIHPEQYDPFSTTFAIFYEKRKLRKYNRFIFIKSLY